MEINGRFVTPLWTGKLNLSNNKQIYLENNRKLFKNRNYIYIFYTDAFYLVNHNYNIVRSVQGECFNSANWQVVNTKSSMLITPNAQFGILFHLSI